MNRKLFRIAATTATIGAAVVTMNFLKGKSKFDPPSYETKQAARSQRIPTETSSTPRSDDNRSIAARDWVTAIEPLNSKERDEAGLVYEQIKILGTIGKIEADKMDEFRSIVYKYKDRLIAETGRRIIFESPDLTKSKEGADEVVTLIDTLAYFGQNSDDWPLSIEILRDIGTRPIIFSSTLSHEQRSTANITIQAFEQYARYRPEEALSFVATNVDKVKRYPYIAYLKTGMALAGYSKEEIQVKTARLI